MQITHFSRHVFWSYTPRADLPEDLIIKQVAAYGEISDLKNMAKLIDREKNINVLNKIKDKYDKCVNFIEKIILSNDEQHD